MKSLFDVKQVANWLLAKESMSPKKLQKMLYYEYSWLLVALNNDSNLSLELFDNKFEAWVHGPVYPAIYEKYKHYGRNLISKPNAFPDLKKLLKKHEHDSRLVNYTISSMNMIFNIYSKYDANHLEYSTHKEDPWKIARKGYGPLDSSNVKIKRINIYKYYLRVAGFKLC